MADQFVFCVRQEIYFCLRLLRLINPSKDIEQGRAKTFAQQFQMQKQFIKLNDSVAEKKGADLS